MSQWTRATAAVAVTALVTGSLNTITNTAATKQMALGTRAPSNLWGKLADENDMVHTFDHPFFLAACMFLGESLCMVVHMLQTRTLGARTVEANTSFLNNRTQAQKGSFWWAIPACLDLGGTGIMYCGLCLTTASVYQMLRGSVVIFTSITSVLWLKRTIHSHQWFAVLMVCVGICVVGACSLLYPAASAGADSQSGGGVLLGDCLIVLAQIITAVQMCVEEKLVAKYNTPTLKAIGLEGIFGFIFTCIMLVPMSYFEVDGAPVENVTDALTQMGNNPWIVIFLIGNMLSIAVFNNAGISVTKMLSATHRMVLDSVRTLTVWLASLAIGWETFHWLQLLGFFILAVGTGIYNDIIKVPCMFTYPSAVPTSQARHGSFCGGAEGHASFITDAENAFTDEGLKPQQHEIPLASA